MTDLSVSCLVYLESGETVEYEQIRKSFEEDEEFLRFVVFC